MVSGPLPPPPRRGPGPPAPGTAGEPRPPGQAPTGSYAPPGSGGQAGPQPFQPDAPAWGGGPPAWSPRPQKTTDGVAVAALVLGIIALLASIIPFGLFLGVPLGIAAIICGVIGMRRRVQRGVAIGGLVTGVLSLLVAAVYVAVFAWFVDQGPQFLEGVVDEPFGAGAVMTDSPCVGQQDVATFEGPLPQDAENITVHQVQACPDFADDVQFGIEMENTGTQTADVEVSVTASAGGQAVTEPASEEVVLEPGERAWVQIVTFDEWQVPEEVNVDLQTF